MSQEPPISESLKTTDTASVQSASSNGTPVVEDPLASLWGEWSAEITIGEKKAEQIGIISIKKEGSNIVMSSDKKLVLTGPINGLQLQMKMSTQMAFSGTYTPNAVSFKLSGSLNLDGKSQPLSLVFTRVKGDDKTTLSRKAEVEAIYSAISEYRKNSGDIYPDRLEAVARFFKGDIALLTSSAERKITYQPKGLDKPEVFFSEDMLQKDSEVPYADQIVAAEAHMHEIGVYDYLFHPALVAIDYSNPTQRIAASSSGLIVVEGDETQLPGTAAEQFVACQNNLKQLGLVEKMFANEHYFSSLSGGWAMVYPKYLLGNSILSCPCRPIGDDSYELLFPAVSWDDFCLELCGKVTGGSVEVATAQSTVPMVVERSTHTINGKQGRNVMFFDGHVEFVAMNDLPQKVDRFVKANK